MPRLEAGETAEQETNLLRPPPWGFWTTLAWAAFAFALGQIAGFAFVMLWMGRVAARAAGPESGAMVAMATIVSSPITCAVLAMAARLARWPVGEYLGFVAFRGRDFLIGLLALTGLLIGFALLGMFLTWPEPSFQIEVYRTAAASGLLPLFVLAAVVFGPSAEETLFRGFLFRGWVRSKHSAAPVVVATALLWSLLHVQYDWFFILQVLAIGLVLGWLRWRSGSTALTLLLHGLINLAATAEAITHSV